MSCRTLIPIDRGCDEIKMHMKKTMKKKDKSKSSLQIEEDWFGELQDLHANRKSTFFQKLEIKARKCVYKLNRLQECLCNPFTS